MFLQAYPNGWFANNSVSDPGKPWTHLIGYVWVGILEIYRLNPQNPQFEKVLSLLHSGAKNLCRFYLQLKESAGERYFVTLPGTFDSNWNTGDNWSCIIGSAQIAFFLRKMSDYTGDQTLISVADLLIQDLKQLHFIDSISDPNLRGSLPGCYPVGTGCYPYHTGLGRQIFRRQPSAKDASRTGAEIFGITLLSGEEGDEKMDTQTIEKGFERVWQMFQETDRKFDRQIGELKELFKQTDKKIGDIAGKWGRFVEGMVTPGMTAMFESRGIRIETLSQRVNVRKNGSGTEIDILGISEEYAVPVEVKSTLIPDDVKEFPDKLKEFRRFFPEYADRKIIGAAAGIVIESGADRFAYRQGLFVIAQKGENVTILNDIKFIPKEF